MMIRMFFSMLIQVAWNFHWGENVLDLDKQPALISPAPVLGLTFSREAARSLCMSALRTRVYIISQNQ